MGTASQSRIDFFERIASCYDPLLDILTLGLYATFLKKAVGVLNPERGEKILELCSGTGRAVSWMAHRVGEEGEVVGMDLAERMVQIAKKRYGPLRNLTFLKKDVTEPWDYENYFDGIFISFSLHEIPAPGRMGILRQSHRALRERGRMVIADFNPQISGPGRIPLFIFFKLFERDNLDFLFFDGDAMLKKVGFTQIRNYPILGSLLQITLIRRGG
jgi:ubiquinone/menaquinone biosynthesis C-methylase UbiE